jgi:hypothetical protein
MQSVIISVAVGLLAFAMGLVGLYLKRLLPERHMSMGSRDMIGAIMGLLSLLLALVLSSSPAKRPNSNRSAPGRSSSSWLSANTDQRPSPCDK